MSTNIETGPAFAPSRLGHANMFVADVERSIAFYNQIAGIELVRREPEIFMAFHSNGNTHHDVGLVQVKPGERLGIKGFVQVSSNRATKPGLNHLGWEMHSEVALIGAIMRAKEAGERVVNFANHQIAHAAYVIDPEGNYHEFYADTVVRWRDFFNLDHEELVTEAWDWEGSKPGLGPMPGDPSDQRRVDSATFHPRRITHATLATARFDDTVNFLTRVGGLTPLANDGGVAMFHGAKSTFDLMLVSTEHGLKAGLQAISFQVENENDFLASRQAAARKSLPVLAMLDLPHKRNIVLADPDGVMVELYYRRPETRPVLPRPKGPAGNVDWLFAA
jgi:catechol 2,3-dioxygenase